MFDDTSLKLKLYFWPLFCFILGGRMAVTNEWLWGGVGLLLLGAGISIQIIIVSIVRERTNYVKEHTDYFEKMSEFYHFLEGLSNEGKYMFGLTYVPSELTVKVDKTTQVGNEFSQTWQKLPVAPYKLKVIAQAAINGEGFSNRKWAGKGKLLSDPEWDALKDKMLELKLIEYRDNDTPTLGFNWTGLGIDTMEQAVRDSIVVARSD
jgi:hypothetical protein